MRSLLVLFLLGLAPRAFAAPVALDFDAFAPGASVTTQFLGQGVVFSGGGASPATAYFDPPEATSSPNILCGNDNFSNLYVQFVDPNTGVPSPNFRACMARLNVISVGVAVITVTSRDGGGNVLQSFVLNHPAGPPNGFGAVDPLVFAGPGIASIDLVFTVPGPPGVDGVGIDDLVFDFECATPAGASTWGRIKGAYR